MKKFLLLYVGGLSPKNKEEGDQVMKEWMSWFDPIRDSVVLAGFPFQGSPKLITVDGAVSENDITFVTGFSVLQGENEDKIIQLAKSCPHLKQGGSIEIKEELPIE